MGDNTMSTVKVEGNPSGSGSVTLKAPNLSSDVTVTLPDGDFTMGGGMHVLLNRSTMNNTSAYVFTATDSSKYDSYYIEFNGIKTNGNQSLNMEFSNDGGSSYLSNVGGNILQNRYATRSSYASSGVLHMAYTLMVGSNYGENCSGYVKLLNPTGGPDRGFHAIGQSAHIDNGANQITSLYSATSNNYGSTSHPTINAFKIKMGGAATMAKGTISVFGVTNS